MQQGDDRPSKLDAWEATRRAFVELGTAPLTPDGLAAATAKLRQAIVMLGLGTPDNRTAVDLVAYCSTEGRERADAPDTFPSAALRLTTKDVCLTSVLHAMEGSDIHPNVRTAFPGITQDEWDAMMRVILMILTSIERRHAPSRQQKRKARKRRAAEGDGH